MRDLNNLHILSNDSTVIRNPILTAGALVPSSSLNWSWNININAVSMLRTRQVKEVRGLADLTYQF